MLSKFDELKLIARCVATDDRNAFGKLVEEYQDGLRRLILVNYRELRLSKPYMPDKVHLNV